MISKNGKVMSDQEKMFWHPPCVTILSVEDTEGKAPAASEGSFGPS